MPDVILCGHLHPQLRKDHLQHNKILERMGMLGMQATFHDHWNTGSLHPEDTLLDPCHRGHLLCARRLGNVYNLHVV